MIPFERRVSMGILYNMIYKNGGKSRMMCTLDSGMFCLTHGEALGHSLSHHGKHGPLGQSKISLSRGRIASSFGALERHLLSNFDCRLTNRRKAGLDLKSSIENRKSRRSITSLLQNDLEVTSRSRVLRAGPFVWVGDGMSVGRTDR